MTVRLNLAYLTTDKNILRFFFSTELLFSDKINRVVNRLSTFRKNGLLIYASDERDIDNIARSVIA